MAMQKARPRSTYAVLACTDASGAAEKDLAVIHPQVAAGNAAGNAARIAAGNAAGNAAQIA